ncbi:MAG TPA: ATP-binding protein [Solirubrobacterales bacterium]|nr:ATP-binding protein [Solirubrobacterales bacterium]
MQFRLFPTAQAPSQARSAVAALAERLEPDSLSDVKTVVSELVTISVSHGASRPIEVRVDVDDGELEGVVCDQGPGARAIVRARELRETSLVLRVVNGLVEDWGTDDAQTRIWFRMAVVPLS